MKSGAVSVKIVEQIKAIMDTMVVNSADSSNIPGYPSFQRWSPVFPGPLVVG